MLLHLAILLIFFPVAWNRLSPLVLFVTNKSCFCDFWKWKNRRKMLKLRSCSKRPFSGDFFSGRAGKVAKRKNAFHLAILLLFFQSLEIVYPHLSYLWEINLAFVTFNWKRKNCREMPKLGGCSKNSPGQKDPSLGIFSQGALEKSQKEKMLFIWQFFSYFFSRSKSFIPTCLICEK